MTGLSASRSNASDPPGPPAAGEVHVHLGHATVAGEESAEVRQLLRACLRDYYPGQCEHWRLDKDEAGRPVLQGDGAPDINWSHSRGRLALAIAGSGRVGVDLEQIDDRRRWWAVARRYFHAEEVQWLQQLPDEQRRDAFFDLWTLKEAHTKARGATMATSMASTAFDLNRPRRIATRFSSPGQAFRLWQPEPGWRLALCQLATGPKAPRIALFGTTAEVETGVAEQALLATSEP